MTLRDFIKDVCGAISAGLFVWCVSVWVPHAAALAHGLNHVHSAPASLERSHGLTPVAAEEAAE